VWLVGLPTQGREGRKKNGQQEDKAGAPAFFPAVSLSVFHRVADKHKRKRTEANTEVAMRSTRFEAGLSSLPGVFSAQLEL